MAGWFVIHSAMRRKGDRGKPAFCVVWHSVHTSPTDCKKKNKRKAGESEKENEGRRARKVGRRYPDTSRVTKAGIYDARWWRGIAPSLWKRAAVWRLWWVTGSRVGGARHTGTLSLSD